MSLLRGQVTGGASLPILLASQVSGILPPNNGGTGIANNLASTITISGAFATTFTITGVTSVTLPTSGTLATTDTTQTISGVKTFTGLNSMLVSSSGLTVRNPANTAKYTITGAAIVADRILNLPLTTAADTLVCLGLAQTFSQNMTFNGDLIKSSTFVVGGNGASAIRLTCGIYTTNGPSYKLTNGGGGVTPFFASWSNPQTAGILGIIHDSTNQLVLTHGNGTVQVAGAALQLTNLTNTANSEASDLILLTQNSGAAMSQKMRISKAGNIVAGAESALATNATDGFLYIPTCAGTPTGVPTAYTGKVAMVFDTTNNKFYIYDGSWLGGTTPGVFI